MPERAIVDGRIFVDGTRATSPRTPVRAGSVVTVSEPRVGDAVPAVLARVGDLVLVDKPAWMSTEPDRAGSAGSLRHEVATLIGVSPAALHALGRLDVGTSGVVAFSTSARGARAWGAARARGAIERRYLAVLSSEPGRPDLSWTGSVDGRPAESRVTVVRAARAVTVVDGRAERFAVPTLAVVELRTGRRHQIRRHATEAGAALFGDRRYGGPRRWVDASGAVREARRLALHSAFIACRDGEARCQASAPVPEDLRDLWRCLGGDVDDLLAVAGGG